MILAVKLVAYTIIFQLKKQVWHFYKEVKTIRLSTEIIKHDYLVLHP